MPTCKWIKQKTDVDTLYTTECEQQFRYEGGIEGMSYCPFCGGLITESEVADD